MEFDKLSLEDIFRFPSIPFDNLKLTKSLPDIPAIYFAAGQMCCKTEIFYIGKTENLRKRWCNHHRHSDLVVIQAIGIEVFVYWMQCECDRLTEIEESLITKFTPPLNRLVSTSRKVIRTGEEIYASQKTKAVEKEDLLFSGLDSYEQVILASYLRHEQEWTDYQLIQEGASNNLLIKLMLKDAQRRKY